MRPARSGNGRRRLAMDRSYYGVTVLKQSGPAVDSSEGERQNATTSIAVFSRDAKRLDVDLHCEYTR